MAYRLKLREPVPEGVRRIGLEQIEIAETRLASNHDVPTAIHDARRCMKRLRALLHVVRPGLGAAAYRREAKEFAAIGKALSRARDRHVMQQTLAKLEGPGALPKPAAAALRKLLAPGRSRDAKGANSDGRAAALARLERARKLLAGKDLEHLTLDHLLDGLQSTYRKSRKAMRKAYAEPSDEAFHAWRKAAQRHWRHMLLLSQGWPEALLARAGEAKELSRLLGEDHDYAVLLAFAAKHGKSELGREHLASLAALCRSRQDELRARAKPRGERLFAEGEESFRQRVALYWSSAARLSGLTAAEEPEAATSAPAKGARRRRRPGAKSPAPAGS
jgi:CHAD domain-containing protein